MQTNSVTNATQQLVLLYSFVLEKVAGELTESVQFPHLDLA